MKTQHDKIKALQLRANPVTYSGMYVDVNGELQQVDLKISVADDNRTIKGYLTVWGVVDTYGTCMVKGCCAKSIRERGPKSESKQKIAHLWQHRTDEPLGQFTVLKEDDYGLYFEADIDDIPLGDRELKQIRSGTLNQFSIGFNYIWDKVEYDEARDCIVLKEIELMEGSVVTFGSNPETYAMRSVEEQHTAKVMLLEETEDFIKSLNRSKQLELRQLIARHISLATIQPEATRTDNPLEGKKPNKDIAVIGGYKINLNEFKSEL